MRVCMKRSIDDAMGSAGDARSQKTVLHPVGAIVHVSCDNGGTILAKVTGHEMAWHNDWVLHGDWDFDWAQDCENGNLRAYTLEPLDTPGACAPLTERERVPEYRRDIPA